LAGAFLFSGVCVCPARTWGKSSEAATRVTKTPGAFLHETATKYDLVAASLKGKPQGWGELIGHRQALKYETPSLWMGFFILQV
jgi:hypothetical protein